MAIEVYENKEAGKRVTLDRRLCLTAAGDRLVEDDTAEAATLYGSAGKEVPRAEFEALGGVVKSAAKPKAEPEPAPVAKPKAEPKPEAKPEAKPKPAAKRKTTKKAAKRKTTKKAAKRKTTKKGK